MSRVIGNMYNAFTYALHLDSTHVLTKEAVDLVVQKLSVHVCMIFTCIML